MTPIKTLLGVPVAIALISLAVPASAAKPKPKKRPVAAQTIKTVPGYTIRVLVYKNAPKRPKATATPRQKSRNANRKNQRARQGKVISKPNPKRVAINLTWADFSRPATDAERAVPQMGPITRIRDAIQQSDAEPPKPGVSQRMKSAARPSGNGRRR